MMLHLNDSPYSKARRYDFMVALDGQPPSRVRTSISAKPSRLRPRQVRGKGPLVLGREPDAPNPVHRTGLYKHQASGADRPLRSVAPKLSSQTPFTGHNPVP